MGLRWTALLARGVYATLFVLALPALLLALARVLTDGWTCRPAAPRPPVACSPRLDS